ncbi:MAG: phage baseplate assembly protein V [Bryobacteraceae bacterium]
MTQHLLDVVAPVDQDRASRVFGVVVGIVTNNKDPDHMGRVKVKFPWLSDSDESWWARIATPMAGVGRGIYFLPEVNDEVLVAFEHGDIQFPYIVGALWNGQDAPPAENRDGKNNLRVVHSRSGHLIRLDDTDGDEKIEIIDKTGGNSITIKASDNSISISCTGRMKLQANGIEISSQSDVKIQAASTMDVESSAPMTIKGAIVNIN